MDIREYTEEERLAIRHAIEALESHGLSPFDALGGVWLFELYHCAKQSGFQVDLSVYHSAREEMRRALARKGGSLMPEVLRQAL